MITLVGAKGPIVRLLAFTAQIVAEISDTDMTSEPINRARKASDEEWRRYKTPRILGRQPEPPGVKTGLAD